MDRVQGDKPQAVGAEAPKPQASEESGAGIVPKKSAKTRVTPVESMEGRGVAKEKLESGHARRIQGRVSAPTEAREPEPQLCWDAR